MNKKAKNSLVGLGSIAVAAAIVVGGFFGIYPMTPDVEIKSAEDRIENNGELLIESYNTDTKWSTYANKFRAIEDYPNILA
jgi:pyruvate/2-oxoacid:ferredoxin oxidoreductase alpha subunit